MAPERTNQFKILLSDQELTVLKEVAEQRGVTASDVLRLYIREQAALLLPQPGVVEKLVKETKRLTRLGSAAEQVRQMKTLVSPIKDAQTRYAKATRSLKGAAARKPKK